MAAFTFFSDSLQDHGSQRRTCGVHHPSIYDGRVEHSDRVKRITPEDRVGGDLSPGVSREQAIVMEGFWTGVAFTEPGVVSGWHHHGNYETSIYVASGRVRLECGLDGHEIIEASVGDFIHVPAGAIHRESNPGDTTSSLVLLRVGTGSTTINTVGPASVGEDS